MIFNIIIYISFYMIIMVPKNPRWFNLQIKNITQADIFLFIYYYSFNFWNVFIYLLIMLILFFLVVF